MFAKTLLVVGLVAATAPAFADPSNPGTAQFAAQLGVNPHEYSLSQLVALDTARRDGETETFNYILANPDNLVSRAANYQTPANADIYDQEG